MMKMQGYLLAATLIAAAVLYTGRARAEESEVTTYEQCLHWARFIYDTAKDRDNGIDIDTEVKRMVDAAAEMHRSSQWTPRAIRNIVVMIYSKSDSATVLEATAMSHCDEKFPDK